MYNKPGYPSHKDLSDARDRVLAKHPKLRVVGAHLGSLEYDVGEVAKRLDLYPNLAVDTSARLRDLGRQDPSVVRQFFLAYPDRILFGTDIVQRDLQSSLEASARQGQLHVIEDRYRMEFAYFETDQLLAFRDTEFQGIHLPADILDRFYLDNALQWYPGI